MWVSSETTHSHEAIWSNYLNLKITTPNDVYERYFRPGFVDATQLDNLEDIELKATPNQLNQSQPILYAIPDMVNTYMTFLKKSWANLENM